MRMHASQCLRLHGIPIIKVLRLSTSLMCIMAQVYVAELAEPLLNSMWSLSDAASIILFAYYERSKAAHARFWDLLPSYFNVEKIPESSYGQNEHAAGIGLFRLHRLEQRT